MKHLTLGIFVLVAPGVGAADTWIVLPDGTGDAPTIQAAVDSAAAGDEVVLGNGFYSEEVDYEGKAITIRSMSGNPEQCIVDCRYATGFIFQTGEGPSSVLEGVHLQEAAGGYGPYEWGAVICDGSSPTIRNITVSSYFIGIHAFGGGSPRFENIRVEGSALPAIRAEGCTPTITGCVLASNASPTTGVRSNGAAITLVSSNATIEDCTITGNSDGGIGLLESSNATVENCRIEGHPVYGIRIHGSSPTLRRCVIVGNVGGVLASASFPTLESCTITRNFSYSGGGLYVDGLATVSLERTIVWGNCSLGGAEDIFLSSASTVNAACSDIRMSGVAGPGVFNAGQGLLDVPPNFCNPNDCGTTSIDDDYGVDDDSPVVTSPCGLIGALAANCTIHVESKSWGAIKAMYR